MATERELKLILTEEEAQRLERALGPPDAILHQRNTYLDSPEGALRAQGYGLRLRDELSSDGEQRFLLTLKGPGVTRHGLSERAEQEIVIDSAAADAVSVGSADLAALGLTPPPDCPRHIFAQGYVGLGTLVNDRRIFRVPVTGAGVVTLELDRTLYPDDRVEWEVEIEWPGRSADFPRAAIEAHIRQIGIGWRAGTRSKFARFLERSGL